MSSIAIHSIDSFHFLLEHLAKESSKKVDDLKDGLAFLGAIYCTRKCLYAVQSLVEAVNAHLICRLTDDPSAWNEKYGPWAVVTGSSAGIGHAYAVELAKRGLNIVLMSRNERRLESVKEEIESLYKVMVEYIVVDFGSINQSQMYDQISEKLIGKEIGLLVNNVGMMYDYPDLLLKVPSQKLWQLINVNIGAATMMTHLILPQMIERGRGGVVVISSGSSTQITPLMTVYSATKRYLDYFIQGLSYEYRHSGVTFQCLIPFYVATRMTGYDEKTVKSHLFIPNAAQYAKSAVPTLGRFFSTTGYFFHTIQLWISNALPLSLWMWASEKLNISLRKQSLQRLARRPSKSSSRDKLADIRPNKSMSKEEMSEGARPSFDG